METKKKLKIALVIILSLCAFVAFLLSPLFNFKSVDIMGAEYYSSEEIQETLNNIYNKNYFVLLFQNTPFSHLDYLFKGRLYESEQKLIFDKPYLKSAEISFSFPMKANVRVTERKPAFLTRSGDEYLLIDSEGYVVEAFTEENKPQYPVIEGVETLDYKLGKSLVGMGTDSQLELAMQICSVMKQIELDETQIDIVDVSDPDRIWLFVKPSLSICIGKTENINIKLSVLKEIFEAGYNGNSDGVIDFTNGKNPIFKKNSNSGELPDSGQGEILDEEVVLDENILDMS